MVRGNELFDWLVRYHTEVNLLPKLPFIETGQYLKRDGTPVKEGEENEDTSGCLILSNGDSLVRRLKDENIILDRTEKEFTVADNYPLLANFLNENEKKDGAFVYDGKHGSITRISMFANSLEQMDGIRSSYECYLPSNFVFEKATSMTPHQYDDHIGRKTDLAMVLPIAHTKDDSIVHAYQIKRTAYGQLGLGKVAHFGPNGLIEEFFFRYDPASKGPFAVPEQGIVGVHRTYKIDPRSSELIVASERLIDPAANFKKCRDCKCEERASLV